jgi:hypothetical protein
MMLQGDGGAGVAGSAANTNSPGGFLHPPMLPAQEEAPMDYLHPPMMLHGQSYQQQQEEEMYFNFMHGSPHPPMLLPGEDAQMMGMGGGVHPPMMYDDVYDANGNMHY